MNDETPPLSPGPDAPRPRGRKRRFVLRWTRRSLTLVVAIVAAVFVLVFSIDLGRFPELRRAAESRASAYLNRPMHIGRISMYVFAGEFGFDNIVIEGRTPTDRPFFEAKHIQVHVAWWELVRRRLVVEVRLSDWNMVVESWANGVHNVPTLVPKRKAAGRSAFTTTVNFVYATGGRFEYQDHTTPWSVVAPNLNFQLVRADNLNQYVGHAAFTGGAVRIMNFRPMATDLDTRFALDGPHVRLEHIDLVTDGSRSHVNGLVDFSHWPDQTYNVESTIDFARMRDIFFSNETWRVKGQGQFAGIFNLYSGGHTLEGNFTSADAAVNDLAFSDLHGSLIWTPDRFAVTHADSDLLGGTTRFTYDLSPLGSRTKSMASFSADYADVDLARAGTFFNLKGLQLDGRGTGDLRLAWPNGKFSTERSGQGHTLISPPAGSVAATATLPQTPVPVIHEPRPFQANRSTGAIGLTADLHYALDPQGILFDPSTAATTGTWVRFSGRFASSGGSSLAFHVTSHDWEESDRLLTGIMTAVSGPTGAIDIGGQGTFDGRMSGTWSSPRIEGRFTGDATRVWDVTWGHADGDAVIQNGFVTVANGRIGDGRDKLITADGRFSLGFRHDNAEEINAHVVLSGWPVADLRHAFDLDDWPMDGTIGQADLRLTGQYRNMFGSGPLRIDNGTAWGEHFDRAAGRVELEGTGMLLSAVDLTKGPGTVTGAARIGWDGTYEFNAKGAGIRVSTLDAFKFDRAPLTGVLGFTAIGDGEFASPTYEFRGDIPDLFVGDQGIGDLSGDLRVSDNKLLVEQITARSGLLNVDGRGTVALTAAHDADLHLTFTQSSIDPYLTFLAPKLSPYARAIVSGAIDVSGPLSAPHALAVNATIHDAALKLSDYDLANDGPISFSFKNDLFSIGQFKLKGGETSLEVAGGADLGKRTWNLLANGDASLSILQLVLSGVSASGAATVRASVTGSFDHPTIGGGATVANGRLRPLASPHSLEALNGRVDFDSTGIRLDGMTGRIGNGVVTFGGSIALDGFALSQYNLTATGRSMRLRYPAGFSSIANMDLQLVGPVNAPRLVGDVDVLKVTVLPIGTSDSGLLGLATATGGPSAAPALASALPPQAGTPLALDIHVTAPPMTFIDTKTARVDGRADLRVNGTFDRPSITGAVDIIGGELLAFGNRYIVREGSILFNDPEKFQPVFDLAAETRPRIAGDTFDINIRITGTLDGHLKVTPTSDPSLPDSEIVTLLVGGTPDTGQAQQSQIESPQELQQRMLQTVGAVLLTAPISSRVGDVVAKTLPVDTVQITPLLQTDASVQQLNPSARITFAKRISGRVTLTYSRTVSGIQDELILLEYDQNDRISWVLSRNEDRTLALDFRIRHVF